MTEAADRRRGRGVLAMVGFTYRRVPAIALARQLVDQGRIGTVRHVRAQYLQDWIADPAAPMSWRLTRRRPAPAPSATSARTSSTSRSSSPATRSPTVSGMLETFVHERPLPGEGGGASAPTPPGGGRGE